MAPDIPKYRATGATSPSKSDSTNLVPNDTNQSNDVFVRDLRAGTTVRASVGAKGQQADAYNLLKAISATGRYVVFVSDAPDLVQGAASGQNLYVRDLKAGTTTLENLDFKGKAAEGIYYEAAITPDGRYLAFSSSAWTLVRQHTEDMNIYRRDRHKGETVLVSVRPDGTGGHLPSWGPFISDDGRVVAFEGASDLIVGGHNSPWSEAVARDMWTGRTELVSVTLDGREPDGNSNVQGLSADGRRVLIDSDVDDLVAGDTNRTIGSVRPRPRSRHHGSGQRQSRRAAGQAGCWRWRALGGRARRRLHVLRGPPGPERPQRCFRRLRPRPRRPLTGTPPRRLRWRPRARPAPRSAASVSRSSDVTLPASSRRSTPGDRSPSTKARTAARHTARSSWSSPTSSSPARSWRSSAGSGWCCMAPTHWLLMRSCASRLDPALSRIIAALRVEIGICAVLAHAASPRHPATTSHQQRIVDPNPGRPLPPANLACRRGPGKRVARRGPPCDPGGLALSHS